MKDIVIIYHGNCPDGFGGAWTAYQKFGEEAEYIGVSWQTPPPDLTDKEVYIIDFSYNAEETEQILAETKSLTALDHHITTKAVTESIPDHLYGVDRSGATLAWDYFFPEENTPVFLKYLEDLDLWKFDLPRSKDFSYFISTVPFNFKEWTNLIEDFEDDKKREEYLDKGAEIRKEKEEMMERMISESPEANIEGYKTRAVHIPDEMATEARTIVSQLGNAIVNRGYEVGVIWSYTNDGRVKVSLRSEKDGQVDVAKIAEKFGGGGHHSAASFKLRIDEKLPWEERSS